MDALASVATVLSAFGADSRQATTALSQGPIARLPTAVKIVNTPAAFTIAPPFIKATPSISSRPHSHLIIEFHGNDRWQKDPSTTPARRRQQSRQRFVALVAVANYPTTPTTNPA